LEKTHNRKSFACEEQLLTDYIKKQVTQDIKKKLAVCFVATDKDQNVIGYYTLTSESLGRELIPENYFKKIPKNYNAPVILLGRLARDIKLKGTGLGEHLLIDALFRAYTLSEESIGAMAVIVDPISEFALRFYKKYGFEQLPDSEKLFLPMHVIKQLI
jgi:predicted GNAT family N-acyltransferase